MLYSYVAFRFESDYDDNGLEKDRKDLEKIKKHIMLKGKIIDPETDIVETNLFKGSDLFGKVYVITNANGNITVINTRLVDGFVFKPIED